MSSLIEENWSWWWFPGKYLSDKLMQVNWTEAWTAVEAYVSNISSIRLHCFWNWVNERFVVLKQNLNIINDLSNPCPVCYYHPKWQANSWLLFWIHEFLILKTACSTNEYKHCWNYINYVKHLALEIECLFHA